MKKSVLILAMSIFSFLTVLNAQKVSEGIYLSANDFLQGKVSYVSDQNKTYKIYLHEAFNGTTIKIVSGESVIKLQKSAIFGYRDSRNVSYRYFNNVPYKIVNPAEQILLYSRMIPSGGLKSSHQVTEYFFSAKADEPLYPLSKYYLKTVLYDQVAFHKLLDVYIHSDEELLAFDNTSKKYQINHIYELSKQQ
jgi:hypothetical protein